MVKLDIGQINGSEQVIEFLLTEKSGVCFWLQQQDFSGGWQIPRKDLFDKLVGRVEEKSLLEAEENKQKNRHDKRKNNS